MSGVTLLAVIWSVDVVWEAGGAVVDSHSLLVAQKNYFQLDLDECFYIASTHLFILFKANNRSCKPDVADSVEEGLT